MLVSVLYRLLCAFLRLLARCGLDDRDLETAVLRHQLKVLGRAGGRPRFTTADRAFLAAASRVLPRERWMSLLLHPDTLARWHRELLSRRRRRRSRRPGRPPLDPSIKGLVLRLGRENPRWGYLRIRGELLKLGIDVSATTIATLLRLGGLGPAPRRIGPTWAQFLRLQAYGVLSSGTRPGGQEGLDNLATSAEREAPASTAEGGEGPPVPGQSGDDCPSRPDPRLPATASPSGRNAAVVLPPRMGARARDGPAVAA